MDTAVSLGKCIRQISIYSLKIISPNLSDGNFNNLLIPIFEGIVISKIKVFVLYSWRKRIPSNGWSTLKRSSLTSFSLEYCTGPLTVQVLDSLPKSVRALDVFSLNDRLIEDFVI
jgi:hypothetical protein